MFRELHYTLPSCSIKVASPSKLVPLLGVVGYNGREDKSCWADLLSRSVWFPRLFIGDVSPRGSRRPRVDRRLHSSVPASQDVPGFGEVSGRQTSGSGSAPHRRSQVSMLLNFFIFVTDKRAKESVCPLVYNYIWHSVIWSNVLAESQSDLSSPNLAPISSICSNITDFNILSNWCYHCVSAKWHSTNWRSAKWRSGTKSLPVRGVPEKYYIKCHTWLVRLLRGKDEFILIFRRRRENVLKHSVQGCPGCPLRQTQRWLLTAKNCRETSRQGLYFVS